MYLYYTFISKPLWTLWTISRDHQIYCLLCDSWSLRCQWWQQDFDSNGPLFESSRGRGWIKWKMSVLLIWVPFNFLRNIQYIYIYTCLYRDVLYSILITTQLILFLVFGNRRRSGRTSHNVLTGGVMSKTSTVSTNFPVGLVFFCFHMFSSKDSNEWTFQLARNDIEEKSPCTCLLDIGSHLAQKGVWNIHKSWLWVLIVMTHDLTLHVNIFLLSCLGSCLVCWMLYNFANLEIDPAFRKRKTASWLFWPT